MQYIFETFSSVANFISTINGREVSKGWGCLSSQTGDSRFTMTDSYDAANELALYGDKASAEKVSDSLKLLRAESPFMEKRAQTKIVKSIIGSRPCVPAAILGLPNSMYRRNTVKVARPVVCVFYSVSMSGSTDASILASAGAKMAEAIQIVERSGVRVNLFVGNTSRTSSQAIAAFVKIKDSAKDFDLLRMAYALVNPSFFRRHWFHWAETKHDLITSEWKFGYGRPLNHGSEEQKMFEAIKKQNIKCDRFFTTSNIQHMTADEIAKNILSK